MSTAALELNDAELAIVANGELLGSERGWASLRENAVVFGADALPLARLAPRQTARRYWATLDEQPLALPLGGARTAADLVHGHLARLWSRVPAGIGRALFAIPPAWTPAQLGLLLGIARDLGIPLAALVESAAAASRRHYCGRALWHLELLLADAWITRLEQRDSGVATAARERVTGVGIEALERASAAWFARRFVECARFDPMHDATSEQRLFDQLPEWHARLGRQEKAEIAIEHHGNRFDATVTAAALRQVVASASEPLVRRLRSLLPPREEAVLQVHHAAAAFPGFIESLARLPNTVVVVLEPGAAARGAGRLAGTPAAQNLRLVSALPWDQPPVAAADLPAAAGAEAGAQTPTHVLFGGRAWRLGPVPVYVGTELAGSDYGIRLEGRPQGVSRRHCTLQVEDGRAVVHDQSRYGTLLNGHRIAGSAVLQAGDVISIGQPPQELRLIVEVPHGT